MTDKIKLTALEEAISYPPLKMSEYDSSWIIEVEEFDYKQISNTIKNHEKLTNFEGAKIDLILEIVQLMSENKIKYNIGLHKTTGFYFRGLPILFITTTNNRVPDNSRVIYVSVKVYKDELSQQTNDIKLTKLLTGFTAGALVFIGVICGASFWLSKKNTIQQK